ncbi:MAG: hypothetical protein HY556_10540 [Euryarchaeota archaeon]|nr:hypothetical protein [Euryarchaeota archaeon]
MLKTKKRSIVAVVATIALLGIPAAQASQAHPSDHLFEGDSRIAASLNLVQNEHVLGIHIHEHEHVGDAIELGLVCVDEPHVSLSTTSVWFAGDYRGGYGGGCFPFDTFWGNDSGQTLKVSVFRDGNLPQEVVDLEFLACVDVNGDGVCSSASGDSVDDCHNTSTSYITGGDCQIYENPSAVDQTAWVFVLPYVTVDNEGNEYSWPLSGAIRLG